MIPHLGQLVHLFAPLPKTAAWACLLLQWQAGPVHLLHGQLGFSR